MEQKLFFSALDRHFAGFIVSLCEGPPPELYYTCALLSHHVSQGHVCIDLHAWQRRRIADAEGPDDGLTFPEIRAWRRQLTACAVVGEPGDFRPLILDQKGRLYLYRYWEYEHVLARRIRGLAARPTGPLPHPPDGANVGRLFPSDATQEPNWQKIAALIACFRAFLVISGSPGTGKTTAVARILALLLESAPSMPWRIALAAPTGKAAARLSESIRSVKETLACDASVRDRIPEQASTVHRLLGSLQGSPYFRHDDKNPLPVDVVVVDEASMLDLPLLSKLVQAMPEQASLILLGDRNQLASVEAGAVLGDLCGQFPANRFSREMLERITPYEACNRREEEGPPKNPGIGDCVVELRRNYRFSGESGIGQVSAAVNLGQGEPLLQRLKAGAHADVQWIPLPKRSGGFRQLLESVAEEGFRPYLQLIHGAADRDEIFRVFEHFRILCALRQGPYGAEALNRQIEQMLETKGLISRNGAHYSGQPLMVTRNSPQLGLYNGDVGLILADADRDGSLTAVFRDAPGRFRTYAPQRLPQYETVYAMTVHKSQGSEFDRILLMLSDRDAPVLTRELVYTGITRARRHVRICSAEPVFMQALSRCIRRTSGLRDALWPDAGSS